jgi:hypothetical protein
LTCKAEAILFKKFILKGVTLVRYQKLKIVSFLFAFALFMSISPLIAEASVKKESKQAELIRVYIPEDAGWRYYIVENPPIKKNDGSLWYKMLFIVDAGRYFQASKAKPEEYLNDPVFSLPYIKANSIKKGPPLSPEDKTAIEDLKQGRPFKLKIGDIVSDAFEISCITQKDFLMYKEPKSTSQKIALPKGSKICYPLETEDLDPGTYIDMEDNLWPPVIDANSKKVLGWRSYYNADDFWSALGQPM